MKDYRQIQARLTPEEKEGMDDLLAKLRLKRELATKAQPELREEEGQRAKGYDTYGTPKDVKNVEGVRQGGIGWGLDYLE